MIWVHFYLLEFVLWWFCAVSLRIWVREGRGVDSISFDKGHLVISVRLGIMLGM